MRASSYAGSTPGWSLGCHAESGEFEEEEEEEEDEAVEERRIVWEMARLRSEEGPRRNVLAVLAEAILKDMVGIV